MFHKMPFTKNGPAPLDKMANIVKNRQITLKAHLFNHWSQFHFLLLHYCWQNLKHYN